MSYQKRIEEMVGEHVAHFQSELTSAKAMQGVIEKVPMPYGYPLEVYRPLHICRLPLVRKFIAETGGHLSNGVPKVLRHEIIEGNLLGVYNPRSRAR
ncbi:MAG: hypothetical protein G8D28_10740 [gamma proteobacterium symbiont of Phacoides pectinatus]|uniref:Uncharacterized protein n=1 Tax=Candidatus Sedimenticola endophacoides TaxID=2548426 RepID=A0A6N4DZE8_9GAMM|nr:MAG: hypothetical protein B0D89_03085 [Candidatus Sedimenticola endophacoides]OQX42588.1 MAG: hypothetical protein B0D88_06400 [Candidatus Sedimenticola endophacoides]PUE02098.1 MAG: hypothetical protein C3L26_01995 [Candidatus Sedimenticola endophacoides]PUE02116.1 MAG: hypothetical protein C3L24_06785 [Candidatus Sedimenticola endophacoides]PUE05090.1 MAG: hypothetical protein C3L25_01990 [Candidatus Sedimenticola endophacoides]